MKIFQTLQEPLSFMSKPSNHSEIPQIPPEPHEKIVLPLKAFRAISFDSKLRFFVILASKFSEFVTLSILAFIHNKLVATLYLLIYFVLCIRKFCARDTVQGFPGASL
jgi:hypothetical protein